MISLQSRHNNGVMQTRPVETPGQAGAPLKSYLCGAIFHSTLISPGPTVWSMKMQIRNGNIIQTRLASGREGGTHQISYHVLHVNILIVSCVEYRNSPDPPGFCVLGMYGV